MTEEKAIEVFVKGANKNKDKIDQVGPFFVKSIIYSYIVDSFNTEDFSSITDTSPREHIYDRIQERFIVYKTDIIKYITEQLENDWEGDIKILTPKLVLKELKKFLKKSPPYVNLTNFNHYEFMEEFVDKYDK